MDREAMLVIGCTHTQTHTHTQIHTHTHKRPWEDRRGEGGREGGRKKGGRGDEQMLVHIQRYNMRYNIC